MMTKLDAWAKRWSISDDAMADLRLLYGITQSPSTHGHHTSEAGIQSLVREEASHKGCRLWRNNVGAFHTADGSFIRYGLANDSASLNKRIKSADLIGIRPLIVTPVMVGCTLGQFVSREVKHAGWRYKGDERERAQLAWAELINGLGGDACFTTGSGSL